VETRFFQLEYEAPDEVSARLRSEKGQGNAILLNEKEGNTNKVFACAQLRVRGRIKKIKMLIDQDLVSMNK
ncbi:hypothetical protein U1Q18_002305, partial [Sarracenia purpurea var. burkii]